MNPLLAKAPMEAPPGLGTTIAMPGPAPSMGAPVLPNVSLASPNISMPGSVPNIGASTPSVRLPTQTETDQTERNRLINSRDGISHIHNPLLRGIARAADIAGSVFAPGLAAAIPGTFLHHQILVNQATRNVANDQAEEQATAQTANEAATRAHTNAATDALQNPNDKFSLAQTDGGLGAFDPSKGTIKPILGPDGTQVGAPDKTKPKSIEEQAYEYALKSGKNPLDAFGAVYGAKNTKDAGLPQQYLDAISSGDTTKAALIKQVIHDTSTQPKIDVHSAEAPRDVGTWTPGFDKDRNPILFNSKTGEVKPNAVGFTKATAAGAKIGADEQKRADLAKNMNENIDALDDIATRRPELFGPLAGRYTELRNTIGTSDPDITKLEAIKHQLGMVAQGAHGMRSAQGVESAANSLVNNFHNTSEATKSGLEAARVSVRTFLDDANNPGASRGDSGPKEGETKVNSHGDKVAFKGGKWGPA